MIHLIEQNIDEMYIKPVENEYKITMIKDEIKYFFMNMPKEAAIDLIDFFNDMIFVNNHDPMAVYFFVPFNHIFLNNG